MLIVFLGVTGVGKTSVMKQLLSKYNWKFVRVATTRGVRDDEAEKINFSKNEFKLHEKENKFFSVNFLFGNYYGLFLDDILKASSSQSRDVYMIDYPIHKWSDLKEHASFFILLMPVNKKQLLLQLECSGRVDRVEAALIDYDNNYNDRSVSELKKNLQEKLIVKNNVSGRIAELAENLEYTVNLL